MPRCHMRVESPFLLQASTGTGKLGVGELERSVMLHQFVRHPIQAGTICSSSNNLPASNLQSCSGNLVLTASLYRCYSLNVGTTIHGTTCHSIFVGMNPIAQL